jgi:integrase
VQTNRRARREKGCARCSGLGGHLKATKTEASAKLLPMHPALKHALLEWRSHSHYTRPEDFLFPSHQYTGRKPLDLASVLKRHIQPAFIKIGITGVGWHTFRHTVGTMLAEIVPVCSPWFGRSAGLPEPHTRCTGPRDAAKQTAEKKLRFANFLQHTIEANASLRL